MLAPPKPPLDPEALIPEARERQRRRRMMAAVTVGALAAAALAVLAVAQGRGTTQAGESGRPPLCSMASVAIQAVGMSSPTGLNRTALTFTNHAGAACRVAGYPTVSLNDAAGTIPFAYGHMGTASPLTIAPRGSAYVVVSKYRCDYGTERAATTARVTMGAESRQVALRGPDLCKPGLPAEGRVVMIYAFKRSLAAASLASLAEFPS